MRKFASSSTITFPSLKSTTNTSCLPLLLFCLFIFFFFFLFIVTNVINSYNSTKNLSTIQIICQNYKKTSKSVLSLNILQLFCVHAHAYMRVFKIEMKWADQPTARFVLLWSSYAINAKPFDLPVPLSRTRLTSTISPYLKSKCKIQCLTTNNLCVKIRNGKKNISGIYKKIQKIQNNEKEKHTHLDE